VIRLVALVQAFALAAMPAAAEPVYDLAAKAPVPHNRTWRDMVRQIFPDLTQEPGPGGKTSDFIHGKINLRPIDKEAFGGDCPDPPRIEYLEFAQVEIARKMRLIVGITTDGDACFGALALFDGTGESGLLDVVNIQQDTNYVFGPDFVRSLGTDGRLVIATSFHTTTSTSPDNDVLILATEDKLSLIGNVVAQSERDCHGVVAEDASIAIAPDYGPFARITGYIKRSVRRLAADCETPQGKEVVTITHTDWRWNAAAHAYRKVTP